VASGTSNAPPPYSQYTTSLSNAIPPFPTAAERRCRAAYQAMLHKMCCTAFVRAQASGYPNQCFRPEEVPIANPDALFGECTFYKDNVGAVNCSDALSVARRARKPCDACHACPHRELQGERAWEGCACVRRGMQMALFGCAQELTCVSPCFGVWGCQHLWLITHYPQNHPRDSVTLGAEECADLFTIHHIMARA